MTGVQCKDTPADIENDMVLLFDFRAIESDSSSNIGRFQGCCYFQGHFQGLTRELELWFVVTSIQASNEANIDCFVLGGEPRQ